ncbi:MAG: DUF4293 domain-containing protein [Rikenellaceae bacterium]
MIQRIQSVYLLITSVLATLCAIFPFAYLTTSNGYMYDLYAKGLIMVSGDVAQPTIYLFVITILAAVVPFLTIFFFNKRMLQIRLCGICTVLLLGIYIIGGVYFYLSDRVFSLINNDTISFGVHPALFAPIIGIVLSVLAGKAILQDELLIRSVNRIR